MILLRDGEADGEPVGPQPVQHVEIAEPGADDQRVEVAGREVTG
jgi:hypothetical protein